MRKIILAACLAVAGCASQSAPVAYSNTVAGAEVALTTAERAALVCIGTPLCSDPATVARIKAADNRAYAAVKIARAGSGSPDLATAAIADLVAAIPVVTK